MDRRDAGYPDWPNLATLMFSRARDWPDKPMLRHHRDGAWHGVSWGEFARRAASVARGLRAAGIAAGDRVLIVSESRPEVPILETALMAIRAVPVPAYTTNTPEDHAHLLLDSGARVAVASTQALAERVQAGAKLVAGLDTLFCMQPGCLTPFAALEADSAPPDDIAAEAELIPSGALACLIYTSGTSGLPRGVMTPHRAILSNCRGAFELVRPLRLQNETYLSFLPLSHSYEHTVGQFFLLSLGTEIVYSRGVEHLAADLVAIRPTIMTVVPRILEVIRARILAGVKRETPFKQRLFQRALDTGLRRLDGRATLLDRIAEPVLDRLVRAKVRARFGGRFRAAMSGGARLDPEVGQFFIAMGIRLMQGYGQTEAGPVIAANPPDAIRIRTVGVKLLGVDLRIAEDSEILVRGDLVMDGYWRQPEATAAAIVDGWLHTGDLGELDAGRLPDHHRPQEGHHRPVRRRERLAGARRGRADERAGDSPSGGLWRRTGRSLRPARAGRGRRCADRRRSGLAGQRSAIGDGAGPPPPAGAALHHREWAADAESEDPPDPRAQDAQAGLGTGAALITARTVSVSVSRPNGLPSTCTFGPTRRSSSASPA